MCVWIQAGQTLTAKGDKQGKKRDRGKEIKLTFMMIRLDIVCGMLDVTAIITRTQCLTADSLGYDGSREHR